MSVKAGNVQPHSINKCSPSSPRRVTATTAANARTFVLNTPDFGFINTPHILPLNHQNARKCKPEESQIYQFQTGNVEENKPGHLDTCKTVFSLKHCRTVAFKKRACHGQNLQCLDDSMSLSDSIRQNLYYGIAQTFLHVLSHLFEQMQIFFLSFFRCTLYCSSDCAADKGHVQLLSRSFTILDPDNTPSNAVYGIKLPFSTLRLLRTD